MSDVLMAALQMQVASLSRLTMRLVPENERVRDLLTEFNDRHEADQLMIERLRFMAYQPQSKHDLECDCIQCDPPMKCN